ncbi:alkene reductase [Aliidiomarina soli]|uniref:Alkene reductase n=1 Tax=Aliidiomarina soli TaxID=1928574 RepID=A0A432WEZ2_9GAMM|nr:alkene reductase [Aliidiomarina soli]RUO32353.1 alkene reductase [Aliidiomarina soli]
MHTNLFSPVTLNPTLTLKNRVAMAPLTRCMAAADLTPTDDMAAYYARRADVGLIISEATIIRADAQGYPNVPGIFRPSHIEGWQKVTDAVHEKGGTIFCQLWHVGRVSHQVFHGSRPVSASAIGLNERIPRMPGLTYPVPRALGSGEIEQLIEDYAVAASNSRSAGFDGVEIHGANGYLLDQFLHYASNHREDEFGGTPENMVRFPLAVVDAVIAAVGADRVGLRLSPGAYAHMTEDPRDKAVFQLLLAELDKRDLAYLHVGIFDDSMTFDALDGMRSSEFLRANYKGTFMGCGSYTADQADQGIAEGKFDLAAIGRPLIANPDYIQRVQQGEALVEYDAEMLKTLV